MKKRLLIALLAGGAVFATVFGVAASLNVTSDSLGAGDATVASCDTDGVNVSYTPEFQGGQFKVTKVTVSDIDQGCSGQELTVQLTGSGGAALSGATGSTLIGGTSAAVNLGTPPAASAVEDVHVVITG